MLFCGGRPLCVCVERQLGLPRRSFPPSRQVTDDPPSLAPLVHISLFAVSGELDRRRRSYGTCAVLL